MFVAALCRQFIFYRFVLTIQSVTIVLVYRESAWAHNMDVHTYTHTHTHHSLDISGVFNYSLVVDQHNG